jgi:lipopolysaccharide/colanic/teichoic acid biosynthesis glycosyltransferase
MSSSQHPDGSWGYDPDRVHVDGRRIEIQKDRTFGINHQANVHKTFTLNLADPLTTTGIRLVVRNTIASTISTFEVEAY